MASSVSSYQEAMGRFETFKKQPDPEAAGALSASLESVYSDLLSSPKPLPEQIRVLSEAAEYVQSYLRSEPSLKRKVEILPVAVSGTFRFASYDFEAFLALAVKVLNAIRNDGRVLSGKDLDDLAAEAIQELEDDPDVDVPDVFNIRLLGSNVRWMMYPSMRTEILFDELAAAPENGVVCQIADCMWPELREDPITQFGLAYRKDAVLPYSIFYLEKGAPRLVSAASAGPIQEIVDRIGPKYRYIQVDLLKDSVFGITYR